MFMLVTLPNDRPPFRVRDSVSESPLRVVFLSVVTKGDAYLSFIDDAL
jgi:hypothetical protein